jgi:hypothetical protein
VQTHATGSGSGRDRGCRAWEVYHVYFTNSGGTGSTAEFWAASGTGLSWGNTFVNTGAAFTGWNHEAQIFLDRDSPVANYGFPIPPNGYGVCGPGNTPATFTVTVGASGAITGTGFNTSWAVGSVVVIGTTQAYPISAVASSTSMTVGQNPTSGYPSTGSGITMEVGSNWDANAGNNGSQGGPCIDQLGRGKGDLIANATDAATQNNGLWPGPYDTSAVSGETAVVLAATGNSSYKDGDVLTVVQSGASGMQLEVTCTTGDTSCPGTTATGTIIQYRVTAEGTGYTKATGLSTTGGTGSGATVTIPGYIEWPSQSFEPAYWWDETLTGPNIGAPYADSGGNNEQQNRDWYIQAGSTAQTSPTSPFNGSTGTGWGTLANRPTTCTAGPGGTYYTSPTGSYGVAYFDTGANQLYVCTATNTWTAVYTPYTYPHPLDTSGSTSGGSTVNGGTTITGGAKITRYVPKTRTLAELLFGVK